MDGGSGNGDMIRYVLKRLVLMIPVLIGVIVIIFTINYISPGDPLAEILGTNASPEQRALKAKELGLDKPYLEQLGSYLWGIVSRGDFGTSYRTGRPVLDEIIERFPVTMTLTLLTTAVSVTLGIIIGVFTAVRHNTAPDYIVTFLSLFGASIPAFWLALMLMLVFALYLGWLPPVGFSSPKHWVLPTLATSFLPLATLIRNTRSSMLDVIRQEYIRTARSKGLPERKILYRHALRNAMIPIMTVISMQIGFSLAGTIIAENIFSIGGIGSLMVTALFSKNYPTIQGCTLWIGFVFSVMNLLVDLGYAWIDPRIRAQYVASGKRRKRKASLEDSLNLRSRHDRRLGA